MFIDSHAHIDDKQYLEDREAVIARAQAASVEVILDIGNGDIRAGSHAQAQQLADHYPFIFTSVGVHPHDALLWPDWAPRLQSWVNHPKVIAWGEIGLDYYYDHSPPAAQQQAFREQLQVARARKLPVIIHTREAEADTLNILQAEWASSGLGGIFHCFTGSYNLAKAALDLGFLVSFSGVITFKKSVALQQTAARLPLDRLLVETDCPFLSPEPFRGKRNEPVRVIEVARQLAALQQKSLAEVAAVTTANFYQLFQLPRQPISSCDGVWSPRDTIVE
jgi:TatD DNase family protein